MLQTRRLYPHQVPRPEDVPEALRGLPVRMITFTYTRSTKWTPRSRLCPKLCDAQPALLSSTCFSRRTASIYGHFYSRHCSFLDRYAGKPTAEEARRPLKFIEEPGLENALWPHLYWDANMCESYERLNHRRLQQVAAEDPDSPDSEDDDAEGLEDRRHSIKRSFFCKLLSPLPGYGSDFEPLQYVFDLHLWTDVGSKRKVANGTATRIMMRGHPMSPLYWTDVKNGLRDLVCQIGYPHLYWTLAPYERSFPHMPFCLMRCRSCCASDCAFWPLRL